MAIPRIGDLVTGVALAFVVAAPLAAHHTAAYIYDVDKPVTLKGTVTEVEWKMPHVLALGIC